MSKKSESSTLFDSKKGVSVEVFRNKDGKLPEFLEDRSYLALEELGDLIGSEMKALSDPFFS